MSSNGAGKAAGYIGKGMPRAATRRLVSGRGRYVDDISLKGDCMRRSCAAPGRTRPLKFSKHRGKGGRRRHRGADC